jgi:hypothetical protein
VPFSYGNIKDSPGSNRRISRSLTIADVAASFENHRTSLYGKDKQKLQHRVRHKWDLAMKSFGLMFANEYSNTDITDGVKRVLLSKRFSTALSCGKVLFSDGFAIYCSFLSLNIIGGGGGGRCKK